MGGDCRSIAGAALVEADSELAGSSDQEKLAVKLSMEELMEKVCTDDLMEALSSMEEIRTDHSEQYRMAIGDRLLLRVLTEERLRAELIEYCGGDTEGSQLFSDRHLEGDSARASLPLSSLLLPVAAASLFLAATVVVTRRRHCSVAAYLLGREASEEAER